MEFKGHDDLVKHITDFYKDLFGPTEIIYIKLEYHICKKFTGEDRAFLTKNFTLEEIKEVVFGMKHYKAVGYDGLPIEFYQFFGIILNLIYKSDLMLFIKGSCVW